MCDFPLQVEDALKKLFSVACPSSLYPASKGFSEDAEEVSTPWTNGERVMDEKPFCGHASFKNLEWLYRETDNTPSNKWVNIKTYDKVS